ncbi:LysM peptidoglycan-binding domain-containing protein [Bacillus sp. AK128]
MILQFSSKQIKILIFSLVVIVLSYTGIYLLFSSKWDSETTLLNSSLKVEEQQTSILEEKLNASQEQTLESTNTLQQKIPVDPLVEQLILDLEKAETVSNSFISSMSFTDGSFTQSSSLEQYQQFLAKDQARSGTSDALTEEGEETENSEQTEVVEETEEQLTPLGLEQVEVSLNVESPNFFDMKTFLNSIESLTRIVRVDSLSFAGLPELTSLDQTISTLKYTVVISTYYFPGLDDLKADLPTIDVPEPSNKLNPFGSITEDEEVVSTTTSNDENVIEHTVQTGENLSIISLKYYQDVNKDGLIKEYNNLSSDLIVVGQILEIPLD